MATNRWRALAAVAVGAVSVAAAVTAWDDDGDVGSGVQRPRLTFEPTSEQQQKIASLRARVSPGNPRFTPEDAHHRENAKLFTYIAGTSEEEHVVLASLDAIQSAYSSRSARKETPDRDLDLVILRHASSEQPALAQAALAAARIPLMMEQPSEPLTRGIAELAAKDKGAARRYAALEALDLLRPHKRNDAVLAAFREALAASEVELVSLSLLALSQSGPSIAVLPDPARAELTRAVLALTNHPNPGVVGRALAVLGEAETLGGAEARCPLALGRLGHAHPYVRAQAADLVSRCEQPAAIHDLVARAGDLAEARFVLEGFPRLDGTPGRLEHVVPGRRRVGEAVLFAIAALSRKLPGEPLQLTLGGPRQSEELVRQNASAAKSWYEAHKGRILRR